MKNDRKKRKKRSYDREEVITNNNKIKRARTLLIKEMSREIIDKYVREINKE